MTGTFIFIILTAMICIISLTAQHAFAYLDPASGSMILQGILAGIAAVGVSVGIFWRRLKLIFSSGKKSIRCPSAVDRLKNHGSPMG